MILDSDVIYNNSSSQLSITKEGISGGSGGGGLNFTPTGGSSGGIESESRVITGIKIDGNYSYVDEDGVLHVVPSLDIKVNNSSVGNIKGINFTGPSIKSTSMNDGEINIETGAGLKISINDEVVGETDTLKLMGTSVENTEYNRSKREATVSVIPKWQ